MTLEELRQEALDNFISVYGDDCASDFDKCWSQLKTDQERNDFRINCCYLRDKDKCSIYFHVFDYNKDCYRDISLKQYRLMNRDNFSVYNCIY